MKFKIRSEESGDIGAIEEVTIAAFVGAPYSKNTEQYIVATLRSSSALFVSLVAEQRNKIIGHVAISPITISDGAKGWFGLGPISVLPSNQRAGVGSELMHSSLKQLKSSGASGCVVLGNPAYYGRFGFQSNSSLVLPGVPSEHFQVLQFSGALPIGKVTYHDAFNAKA